ncbi:MAG: phosphoenolpyruvate carboxylase, partial [bacterium]
DAYRHLVYENPSFWDFVKDATPIKHISLLTIASRPVSRSATTITSLDDLRAIPWNFAWVQSRYLMVGWYGVGAAVGSQASSLQDMYKKWAFFRTLVDNCQLELARTLMPIAQLYGERPEFAEPLRAVSKEIEDEFAKTREAVLGITGSTELLQNARTVSNTIRFRNPLVEPLHLLQIELMKTIDDKPELKPAMTQTIAGIAAAMQSTG